MKSEGKLILSCLLLGSLYSILFYDKAVGVSLTIFMIGVFTLLIYILKEKNAFSKHQAWLFAVPIFLLSFRFFLSSNNVLGFFNFYLIILLFVGMTLLLANKEETNWASLGFLGMIVSTIFMPVKYFNKPYQWVFYKCKFKKESQILANVKKVLIGLFLSLPLLLIIISLLSSADMVFSEMLSFFPTLLRQFFVNIVLKDFTAIFTITLFVGTYTFSYIYHLFGQDKKKDASMQESSLRTEAKNPKTYIDPIILMTVLVMVDMIYLLFSLIQFSYLFGGGTHTLPLELSYAEYARRGFFELLLVTMINFSIMLFIIYFSDFQRKATANILKTLLFAMGIFTYVMLYSSFYRMGLYEQKYGYTYLRVFVYFFLFVESVSLIGTLAYIVCPKFNLFKMYFVIFLVFYIGLNYINIDSMIAKKNIDRYFKETHDIDIHYLQSLPYDAVPQITRLLKADDAAIVNQTKEYLEEVKKDLQDTRDWQEFNLSEYRAKTILLEIDMLP